MRENVFFSLNKQYIKLNVITVPAASTAKTYMKHTKSQDNSQFVTTRKMA